MGFKFSKKSIERLSECDPKLQQLMYAVIEEMDITVLCGHRGEKEQNECYKKGTSKAKWGQSKHNTYPSVAIDIAPYPVDWDDIERFNKMGELVLKKADELGIKIRWGRDFRYIKDYPHFELI